MAPGSFRANAQVHFAPAMQTRIGLEAQVTMASGHYGFSTPGGLGNGNGSTNGLRLDSANTFSGELRTQPNAGGSGFACGAGGCSVQVQGGFFGPDASRLGVTYSIADPASADRTISGVGVLEKR
jgi:hypothetical protein